ncbi:MAG: ATP-binding cassette domain-containing protein [Desulfobacteraceae bacterium]|nr:ATP-binding cassette domain-containing protein [Desulfobacteraceae bacterium]
MALVSIQEASLGFGGPLLLEQVDLQVEKGERVALIGRNGEGKTTLLSMIEGRIAPDTGKVFLQKGIRVAGLPQDVPGDLTGTVRQVVAGGLQNIENYQVDTIITRLSLNAQDRFESLSVGFKRKTLLARSLVAEPDLLLLDEPTNHLDIASITWLEQYLQKFRGSLIFITHDRAFLQKLATRIVTLDRGSLASWDCGYKTFLKRSEAALEAQAAQRGRFLRKLAAEEQWIRQGIKARRTRNEGRVRELMRLRQQQKALRTQTGKVNFQIEEAARTGKAVIEGKGIGHGFGEKRLIHDFSIRIMRGDRIGIIGPNGIGKTTLLRILLGQSTPQKGWIRLGAHLKVVYFDQLRGQLDADRTVRENISGGQDMMDINGRRRHVMGYLKDFLFTPDRARSPVRILSGGERNRLLLARLFAMPSNVLVLDEPTNDLDTETLELLEEKLLGYSGVILLVSHDRAFLNGVVTSTLVFEENGAIIEYAGGYDDWLIQRPRQPEKKERIEQDTKRKNASPAKSENRKRPRKLTFNEKRELDQLPGQIETLETGQKELCDQMADPDFYKKSSDAISQAKTRLDTLAKNLEQAYSRWETLESIREGKKH